MVGLPAIAGPPGVPAPRRMPRWPPASPPPPVAPVVAAVAQGASETSRASGVHLVKGGGRADLVESACNGASDKGIGVGIRALCVVCGPAIPCGNRRAPFASYVRRVCCYPEVQTLLPHKFLIFFCEYV